MSPFLHRFVLNIRCDITSNRRNHWARGELQSHTFVCLYLLQLYWFLRSGQDQLGGWQWNEQRLVHLVQPIQYPTKGGHGQMEKLQSPHHLTVAAASSGVLSAWPALLLALL
jgi:hypothetical protein